MTENELNEIEARANAATPGKWKHVDMRRHQIICEDKYIGGIEDYENANFITHAREDIPELVAEVRKLRAEMDVLASKIVQVTELNCPDFGIKGEFKCLKELCDCKEHESKCWIDWARWEAEQNGRIP